MFGATHQYLKQYLIKKFSTHSRREGTITTMALQCTELYYLSYNYPSSSQHDKYVYYR